MGLVWNEAIFKEYIADPKKKLPGIKMLFPGIRDELNRDDLFA
jgi:cytochrome c